MPVRRGHLPPGPEESQPLAPRGHIPQRRQAGGGSDFITVNHRLWAPLGGLDPNNVRQGGYGFLSYTDNGMTRHPGVDLNSQGGCDSDLGGAVVAPLAGVTREVLYAPSGEGNHVWMELTDPCTPGGSAWLHVDHLQAVLTAPGQAHAPGEQFGKCGKSGGWDCAHLHLELLFNAPRTGFWQWPYGWSAAQVEAEYWDPAAWWQAATALVYAEGNTPPPPEVVETMNDWELTNYVLAQLYEWTNAGRKPEDAIPFNPDGGLAKTWVAALRANVYAGRPRTDERKWGDPNQGVWAEFDHRILIYKNDGTMSWTG